MQQLHPEVSEHPGTSECKLSGLEASRQVMVLCTPFFLTVPADRIVSNQQMNDLMEITRSWFWPLMTSLPRRTALKFCSEQEIGCRKRGQSETNLPFRSQSALVPGGGLPKWAIRDTDYRHGSGQACSPEAQQPGLWASGRL